MTAYSFVDKLRGEDTKFELDLGDNIFLEENQVITIK